MTLAVGKALTEHGTESDDAIRAAVIEDMQAFGKKYPDAGYGDRFNLWLRETEPKPYHSYGNGCAMRVSSAGWLYPTMEETLHAAELTAGVTHNHKEGLKGAKAVAAAVFLARTGSDKDAIRRYITEHFGYDLTRTLDEIRPNYGFIATCQRSVPEAITAFLEANNYEEVVRGAVSLGGDSDTIACMAGAIGEAFYGIPEEYKEVVLKHLDSDEKAILTAFQARVKEVQGANE